MTKPIHEYPVGHFAKPSVHIQDTPEVRRWREDLKRSMPAFRERMIKEAHARYMREKNK